MMDRVDLLASALEGELFGQAWDDVIDIPDIVEWASDRFFVVESKRPILLQPVQKAVLRAFFERKEDGRFRWKTGLYSTIKKSGKTTIAAVVQQWAAETWGDYGEIYHMGNKQKQAKERAFRLTRRSIELSPWKKDWEIKELEMIYHKNGTIIQALPVNAAGEAGGNQRLTTWTELHGYVYEAEERMWDELQPVPTQPLSFRFAESYAGYEGESNLLWRLWALALDANEHIRLHDEYPIYGVPSAGLVAYIDTGIEARRMPWQTPEYYRDIEKTERPQTVKRIHYNEWASAQSALVDIALWDGLKFEELPLRLPSVALAVDASKSGDCTAVSVWTLIDAVPTELETYIFEPPAGGTIDYETTIRPAIDGVLKRYRVAVIGYDEYQLHYFMSQLEKVQAYTGIHFEEFGQNQDRVRADTAFEAAIRNGTLAHSGNVRLREHIQNADGKDVGDKALRIIKRKPELKIDGAVAASMARELAMKWLDGSEAPPTMQIRHNLNPIERSGNRNRTGRAKRMMR